MDRFKQLMGFLLLATAVWLLAVFGAHAGVSGLVRLLGFLLLVALFCWVHGTFLDLSSSQRRVLGVWSLTLVGLSVGYVQLLRGPLTAEAKPGPVPDASFESGAGTDASGVTWEPYSPEVLSAAVADGRTVFLDLTADWCWTCKVNEKTVLADDDVEEMFLRNGVLTLKGDWTRKDPEITEILRRHDRAGVPFYAVYPAGRPEEPIVLPEIINKRLVLESLERAGPSRESARAS
jgi:thiol:disulfide interchange protein DsbD